MTKISEVNKDMEVRIDKIISIALMSSFIVLTFQYLILISFNLLETSTALLVQTASKVVVGLIFVIALPHVLKRKLKLFILIYGLALIVFSYNFLVFPENYPYLVNLIFPLFFMALPSFIYALSIKDLNIFNEITEKSAFLIFIFGIFLGILIFTGTANAGAYSMSLSYYMLLPALVFLGKVFDRGKLIFIIYFLITFIVIFALGSRGAILCIAVYAGLRVISLRQIFSPFKIFIYGIATITLVLSILNYERILMVINIKFLEYGIQSRSVMLLLQDEVYLSGRDDIIQVVWNKIIESPYIGIGLAGDSRLFEGSYVHNFIIEVIGNYGIPIGILLLGILLIVLVITLILSKNYNLIALWMSLGIVHLMVSSSYIIDIKFWIFLGILVSVFVKLLNEKNKGTPPSINRRGHKSRNL